MALDRLEGSEDSNDLSIRGIRRACIAVSHSRKSTCLRSILFRAARFLCGCRTKKMSERRDLMTIVTSAARVERRTWQRLLRLGRASPCLSAAYLAPASDARFTQAEAAFRTAKSDLKLRPIYHQKTERVEAHILV